MSVENMLLAQRTLNDLLQLSSLDEKVQMMLKIQTLRSKNQMLKDKLEQLKSQIRADPIVPKPVPSKTYQSVLLGLHNIF